MEGIFDLVLEAAGIAEAAKPGQFVSLYLADTGRLLPRPVSLCGIDPAKGTIRLVYRVTREGSGTDVFSHLKKGDQIQVLGPLGNGFPLDAARGKTVLIGGGIGIPPLLETAKALSRIGTVRVGSVLGYRDKAFLADEFAAVSDLFLASETGQTGIKGTVLDAMEKGEVTPDVIFSCGPVPMLKAVASYALSRQIPCYVSMEERMACGLGACLGCVVKTRDTDPHSMVKNKRVCKDGPVFEAGSLDFDKIGL